MAINQRHCFLEQSPSPGRCSRRLFTKTIHEDQWLVLRKESLSFSVTSDISFFELTIRFITIRYCRTWSLTDLFSLVWALNLKKSKVTARELLHSLKSRVLKSREQRRIHNKMAVNMIFKRVLFAFVALQALSSLKQTMSIITNGVTQDMYDNPACLLLASLTHLILDVIGLYGISEEHFISCLIFCVGCVFTLIVAIFLSLFVIQKVFMVYAILVLSIVPSMMIPYTIMIRKKTPVEGSIAFTKNLA